MNFNLPVERHYPDQMGNSEPIYPSNENDYEKPALLPVNQYSDNRQFQWPSTSDDEKV